MIDIYAIGTKLENGTISDHKVLIQQIPAGSENGVRLLAPTVKNDMGNADSMDFSLQPGTEFYDIFVQFLTYILVEYQGDTIFYGRVLTISNGFFGEQKIHCEGALAFLNDTYYPSKSKADKEEKTILQELTDILDNHNYYADDDRKKIYIGEVPGNYSSRISASQQIENKSREFGSTSWTSSKSAIEDLKSHYGGLFRIRYEGGKCYLDWMNHYYRNTVNTQMIEVGKNLIDISDSTEVSNIFTAIIPIGKSSSGSESIYLTGYRTEVHGNGAWLAVPDILKIYSRSDLESGYHEADDYENAVDTYGWIYKTVSFDDAHSQEDLLTEAAEWIKNNYQGGVTTFTVKAIDMRLAGENAQKILIGDQVTLKFPVGLRNGGSRIVTLTRTCTSVQYDLFNPENNQYTFGIPANALGKTYGDNSQKQSKKQSSKIPDPEPTEEPEEDEYTLWVDEVREWLKTHLVWKKSTNDVPTGYTGTLDNSPLYGNYLQYVVTLDNTGKSNSALIVPRAPTVQSGYKDGKLVSWYDWPKESNGRTRVYPRRCTYDEIYTNELVKVMDEYKLFDFIYYEWGVSLRTDLTNKQPSVYDDGEGNVTVYAKTFNVVSDSINDTLGKATMTINSAAGSLKLASASGDRELVYDEYGNFGFYQVTPDGRTVMVTIGEDGDYKFIDAEGNETTLRGLHEATENHKNFIGHVVEEGYAGPDGTIHSYKFGQEIVKSVVGDGQGVEELVVAYVDGDLIKIGSNRTRSTVSVARYNNGSFVDPKTWVWEEDDKGQKHKVEVHITQDNAGTSADVGYYDSNGNFVEYTPLEGQTTGPNGEKLYAFVRTGLWDPKLKTFLGGLVTRREESGDIVSYVDSERLVIGNPNDRGMTVMNALLDAGVITQDEYGHPTSHALVADAVYAQKIRAIDAHFQTIETDYLKTTQLNAEIGNIPIVYVNQLVASNSVSTDDHLNVGKNVYCSGTVYLTSKTTGPGGYITTYSDLGTCFSKANISLSGNTYTLNLYDIKGNVYTPDSGKTLSFSRAISAFSGSWSGNILYVTASPQNQTWAREIRVKTYEWSGTNRIIKYTTWMVPGYGSETQYEDSTECTFSTTISISSLISKITADTVASTSSEDPERTTFTAKAINSPGTTLASSTFTLSRTTRRVGSSTNKAVVLKENATGAVVARIDAQTFYTDGYTAGNSAGVTTGKNSVTLNDPTWSAWTSSGYPTSRTVSVTTSGRPTQLTKSVGIYLTGGSSFSSNKTTVYMRAGSTSGTIYAATEVDASSVYNSGFKAGWEAYYDNGYWWAGVEGSSFNVYIPRKEAYNKLPTSSYKWYDVGYLWKSYAIPEAEKHSAVPGGAWGFIQDDEPDSSGYYTHYLFVTTKSKSLSGLTDGGSYYLYK